MAPWRRDQWNQRVRAVTEADARLARAEHGKRGAIWAAVAREAGVAAGTLRNWHRAWRQGGAAALIPTAGLARADHTAIPDELAERIEAFWLDQRRPTAAQVFRFAVRPWAEETGR